MGYNFNLQIKTIKIGTMESASSLNIGKNRLKRFKVMSKTNQGVGNIYGNNTELSHSKNQVDDPDGVDMIWVPKGKNLKGIKDVTKALPTVQKG